MISLSKWFFPFARFPVREKMRTVRLIDKTGCKLPLQRWFALGHIKANIVNEIQLKMTEILNTYLNHLSLINVVLGR
jgi:hypothetical protein